MTTSTTAKKSPAKKAAKKTSGAKARTAKKAAPAARATRASVPPAPSLDAREISVSKLRASDGNPRGKLEGLEGLAASIREVGVLQALIVTDDGGGFFRILAGHRRARAAKMAGLVTVPCLVRAATDPGPRLVAALIENIQREDLGAIDEARAFRALIDDHGLDQEHVATRLGVSPAHVSRRLALLKLPAAAQKVIAVGEFTMAEAYELSKLADAPDRVALVLGVENDEHRREILREQIDDFQTEQRWAKARADLEAKGQRVIDRSEMHRFALVVEPGSYAYDKHLALDVAKHKKEPCSAIVITMVQANGRPVTRAYCTDPTRHGPKGDSDLKVEQPARGASTIDAAERARRKAQREAFKARQQFMVEQLAPTVVGSKITHAVISELALRRYATSGWAAEAKRMCLLLGVDPNVPSISGGTRKDYGAALQAYLASADEETLMRAALARVFAEGEEHPHGKADEHWELLVQLGWVPTEIEQDERAMRSHQHDLYDAESILWRYNELREERGLDEDPDARGLEDELDALRASTDFDDSAALAACAERARAIHAQIAGMLEALTPSLPLENNDGAHADPAPADESKPEGVDQQASTDQSTEGPAAPSFSDHDGPDASSTADPTQLDFPPETLTGYAQDATNKYEQECRDLVEACDPTAPMVAALQQELYRGVNVPRADKMRSELRVLARRHPRSASGDSRQGGTE